MAKSKPQSRSPLAAKTGGGALHMQEITGQALFNLRGAPDNAQFTAAAETALGIALPVAPNTSAQAGGRTILWLGPNEWQIRAADSLRAKTWKALQEVRTAAEENAALVDISDYYTVIRIEGGGAREALAAGCPLDLHPSQFAVGQCAQSRYGRAAVLIFQCGDAPVFDIQVRWSFADYVWEYLRAACGQ